MADEEDQFEGQYAEVKAIVIQAKEAEDRNDFKQAKSLFLDAATLVIKIAKNAEGVEEITFRNIARMLIDYAKEMQQLLEIEKNPLPTIPGISKKTKEIKPKIKPPDATLLQLLIVKESGLPIYNWTSVTLSERTQDKINDILFSGAITAVNSLISEVLSKPIQSIQFEDGNILLRFVNDIIFITFSEGDPASLENNIQKFSHEFIGNIYPKYEADVEQGLSLSNVEEIEILLKNTFTI